LLFLSDDDVARLVTPTDALDAVTRGFAAFGHGEASVQPRVRTDAGGAKLSTLGAVLPGDGVLGAKVYSTVGGGFTFLVVLFAADDGRRLAVLESGALTELRAEATSVLATRVLHGDRPVRRVVVFGSGVQGRGHARAFASAWPDAEITTSTRASSETDAAKAVADADVVVTATRSVEPVLRGKWLPDGVHVCAVGSSRPEARELDEDVYRRADVIAVEWTAQARHEAGGLVQAVEGGLLAWDDVAELGPLTAAFGDFAALGATKFDKRPGSRPRTTVFQSVGIGLEDVAVAAVAWRRAVAGGAGMRLDAETRH
jgi:ornithine cyclodeaminase